jgi:cell division protein FtsI (penicillin-binding protein 3)
MRTGPDPRQARWIAIRMALISAALFAGFAAIAARAVKLQIVDGAKLQRYGVRQWDWVVELRPRRGLITARNGETLAASADAPSIAAEPAALARLDRKAAARLARALGLDPAVIARKAQRGGKFTWLKRRVSPGEAAAVKRLELDGVAVLEEARRYYPGRSLAAQLVGFVGDDGEGLEGIERAYDEMLQGGALRVPSLRDARGRAVMDEAPAPETVLAGARVELALDVALQHVAETALSKAVAQARARSGMLVAMDPRTGEVLALAQAPGFNPNAPGGASMRNRAVLDTFEPGSTFKIFTVAGALDARVLRPGDYIDCEKGSYRIGGHVIHDHKSQAWVPPSRIVITSSNIGAAKIGASLGRERLQRTLLGFGFGEKTGTEIAGEPRGQVPYPKAEISLATMSFGQGVTATPLQITTAMAAIANGGMLMKPILVRRVVDSARGTTIVENQPTPIRRAVSRESAALLSRWMEGVVTDRDGTGKKARLDGWRVAGKTGTGQKADPVTHRYSADKRFSSFVGFAPAERARIVIGVFIDEPKGEVYGGEIAAPVFREVADHAMKALGVPPSEGATVAEAAPAHAPLASYAPPSPAIEEAVGQAPRGEGQVAVPLLTGLPARSALKALAAAELVGEVSGSGRVTGQSPQPGEVVARGARVRLSLAPAR